MHAGAKCDPPIFILKALTQLPLLGHMDTRYPDISSLLSISVTEFVGYLKGQIHFICLIFWQHTEKSAGKTEIIGTHVGRLLSNIEGLRATRRCLLASMTTNVLMDDGSTPARCGVQLFMELCPTIPCQ